MKRTLLNAAVALAFGALPAAALAQAKTSPKVSDSVVTIGLILDMSSLYADITGEGSATAVYSRREATPGSS